MGEKSSSTEHHSTLADMFCSTGGDYKTTISDGDQKAEGTAYTPEGSQENASQNWNSGNTESTSPCYLTTACVKAKKLPDNCLELEVLRNFKNNVLMKTPKGRKAVKEYYKIAPEIVQAVEKQENSQEIWENVYSDIQQAVSLIGSGNFNEAFKHYQEMTLRLKENYLN